MIESGETINQIVAGLKAAGYKEKEIAEKCGLSSTDKLRQEISKSFNETRLEKFQQVKNLYDKGYNYSEISRALKIPTSSVAYMLKHNTQERASKSKLVAEMLMSEVDEKGMIDVGDGVELSPKCLGISRGGFVTALRIANESGYPSYTLTVPQLGSAVGNVTKILVLCPPGMTRKEAKSELPNLQNVEDTEIDTGETDAGIPPVQSISSDRIYIRYYEDGGVLKDGSIEIKKGVPDLCMGDARYGQVRIAVDGKYYLKGVARYTNYVPEGKDIIYNSNKHRGTPIEDVFKGMEKIKGTDQIDWDNPFGASIKPAERLRLFKREYVDKNGVHHISPINVVYEPGDWMDWNRTLSPQFLSKQQLSTIKKQLNLTAADRHLTFERLMKLTNGSVKKKLLRDFAESCDRDSVDLKALPYPTQQNYVLIPFPDMDPKKIYAPNFNNGDIVALIRYPHAGKFEIAVLVVDNTYEEAREVLGTNPPDAIGISHEVAEKLSGADFDGDSITMFKVGDGVNVEYMDQPDGLKNYEPKEIYSTSTCSKCGAKTVFDSDKEEVVCPSCGKRMKIMGKKQTQTEMGLITNLIADMQLKGAPLEDVIKADRHSMAVIDARKHKLNYNKSYKDNDIRELKIHYQGGARAGASTLITRAGSKKSITWRERKKRDDKLTGEKLFEDKPRKFKGKKDGKEVEMKMKVERMLLVDNAYELLSGNDGKTGYPQEIAYADFANDMKQLANLARKEAANIPSVVVNPSARVVYAEQVKSLVAKLRLAKENAPRERRAMAYANTRIWAKFGKLSDKSEFDKKQKEKIRQQYLAHARVKFQAHRHPFTFTDEEWEAINLGAISQSMLDELLQYANMDHIRERATPREDNSFSQEAKDFIFGLASEGFTTAEIAERLGCSVNKVQKALGEKKSEE